MKKYRSPRIKLIELDPKQAILQMCAVGGIFLTGSDSNAACGTTSNPFLGVPCSQTPKGGAGGFTTMSPATSSARAS